MLMPAISMSHPAPRPVAAAAWLLVSMSPLAVGAQAQTSAAAVAVANLRCEYQADPIGIDEVQPRLSWQLRGEGRDLAQSAYQIEVKQRGRVVWDSGRVASRQSAHVPYGGPRPASSQRYEWRVRVWDGSGRPSAWSAPASWEMGLLTPADWTSPWVEPAEQGDGRTPQPAPMLRGSFVLRGAVLRARAYATSRGLYQLEINGRRVGEDRFTPGWTSYRKRLQYQTYDVTALLRPGENVVGAMLGDGWYRGYLAWNDRRNVYGDRLALRVQLRVEHTDGRVETHGTDGTWTSATGPILMSDIYMGEAYDARLERPGWSAPGYDAKDWTPVRVAAPDAATLVAPAGPPVRAVEEIRPVRLLTTPAGETVFDMGQNMVGHVRLRVRGPAGTEVKLRHAETLDKAGNFYTANLRAARQQVTYVLKGGGEEVYEPHFTFQGFRFVAVDGWPGEPTLDGLTGIVVHSAMTATGRFTTSNTLLNKLQHNIRWGQKGNFLDVPTDCPQRDERLGWTGDAQVFSRTAAFNFDVAGFFTKWLADLAADQQADGAVPFVIPDVLSQGGKGSSASAAWADAATIIPWNLYLAYGDRRLLERQYPSMKAWVEYMRRQAGGGNVWRSGFHFGDWLAFATTASDYPGATTGKDLIATAFYARSVDLLQRAADLLGKPDEAAEYAALLPQIKAAFVREFVTPAGRVGENTQTAYALALEFDLLPADLRDEAARRLASEVTARGHLTTGFVGTPYLCHVLSRSGRTDVAYALLNRDTYPSWLYPVKQGATTIWERWDGVRPDGSFQDTGMNSFNHYAYGAIGEWMYRVVAGLDTDPQEPGYAHVLAQPQPGGGLTSAEATLETLYGEAGSGWVVKEGRLIVTAIVPPNARGTVRLPWASLAVVREGGRAATSAPGVRSARQEGDEAVVEVGSGAYRFEYPAPPPLTAPVAGK
jgi:alpha-L-rhamnosidase